MLPSENKQLNENERCHKKVVEKWSHMRPTDISEKEQLMCKLWSILNETSEDHLTEDDLDLWGAITKHSIIQNRIKNKLNKDSN